MRVRPGTTGWQRWLWASAIVCLLVSPLLASTVRARRQEAAKQFTTAERMREELNGMPQQERSRREYQRVMSAYRRVYYMAPGSGRADDSVVAIAELLAEQGRAFHDEKSLRDAIGQYEFLLREYPTSRFRIGALFTIGQIYKEDLAEGDKARESFETLIQLYPRVQLAADAREAIAELTQQSRRRQRESRARVAEVKAEGGAAGPSASAENSRTWRSASKLPLVTGIRHWSTPDYTRVAIDLEQGAKYEAARIPDPDRIFFDLHDTRLASTLQGKVFDVSDGFLRRVRVAQYQKDVVRVVLDVDSVSDYSAFLLPNPYRLIIDIHGRKTNAPQTLVARAQQEHQKKKKAEAKRSAPAVVAKSSQPVKRVVVDAAPRDDAANSGESRMTYGPRMPDGSFFSRLSSMPAHGKANGTERGAGGSSQAEPSSTKTEIAALDGKEEKATASPTSEPTVKVVAPRDSEPQTAKAEKKPLRETGEWKIHQARPEANGRRSLIRALGLKVGRIVIDAGHGGHDTGTIGPSGLQEKDLVLDVGLRLGQLLQERMGADVVYTREDDTFVPLETRTAIANQEQADLFISIHANSSSDASARGVETYYLNFNPSREAMAVAARENAVSEKSVHELSDLVKKIALGDKVEESREFASDVQEALWHGLATKRHKIRDRGVKQAPFIVLIGANMPSILTEISFVSNPHDERNLEKPKYRQKIAESLYRGIARYVNGLSGMKLASRRGPETDH
jgi:N-acetylmuramoyl-L-alanine amidase